MSENGFLLFLVSLNPVRSPVYPPGYPKIAPPAYLEDHLPGLGYVVKINMMSFFLVPLRMVQPSPFQMAYINGL